MNIQGRTILYVSLIVAGGLWKLLLGHCSIDPQHESCKWRISGRYVRPTSRGISHEFLMDIVTLVNVLGRMLGGRLPCRLAVTGSLFGLDLRHFVVIICVVNDPQ